VRLKLHHSGSRAATAPGGFKIFDDENIKAGQYISKKMISCEHFVLSFLK